MIYVILISFIMVTREGNAGMVYEKYYFTNKSMDKYHNFQ